jgi:predicted dehydrogenase
LSRGKLTVLRNTPRVPTPLPITDRPVRVAVVGLGQIAELCLPPYLERDDVEIVGLCDVEATRIERWAKVFPAARTTTDLDTLLTFDADVVDVLVPTPRHCEVVTEVLHAGFHVQVQKPLARSLDEADRMLAARRDGAVLRVMEDYVCFPPLAKLREVVESGALGPAQSMHMKIVATPYGGWDVNPASYVWQFEQARDGHGILTFDHGWHQLAVAHWLFGPVRRVFGWVRKTPIAPKDAPEVVLDAPATFVWEHDNDVRVVLDVTLAPEMYFRSDFYADDERVEVTGSRGYVRCNRISGRGIEEPSVVVYRDGEVRQYHALDDQPPDAFVASAANGIEYFRTGHGPLLFDGETSRAILATLLTALESSEQGVPLDVER